MSAAKEGCYGEEIFSTENSRKQTSSGSSGVSGWPLTKLELFFARDAVFAEAFGEIHPLVGPPDEIGVIFVEAILADADADGYLSVHIRCGEEGCFGESPPQSIGNDHCFAHLRQRKEYGEFLAAEAIAGIGGSQEQPDNFGQSHEHFVPFQVAVRIIVVLEIVHIKNYKGR